MNSCYYKAVLIWRNSTRKIHLSLQEFMMVQHNQYFTDSCINMNPDRRTRENQKDIHFGDGWIVFFFCV